MSPTLPRLIDTHCHLTTFDEQGLQKALEDATACGVDRFICIGASVTTETALQAVAIAERCPEVWASVGIHPHCAGKEFDFGIIEKLASQAKVRAIGETGLDFFRDWAPKSRQEQVFVDTIALAKKVKKPLIIHCREALLETFTILKREGADSVGGVFHCYSGDENFARELSELNFLVSFPGSLTFKKSDEIRRRAKEIPLTQIMLETDCPYMAPEPFRGQPSEPKHVYQIALKLAEIKGISLEEVAQTTTANAERFFRLFPSADT